jgi:signal transduction histidine kinase
VREALAGSSGFDGHRVTAGLGLQIVRRILELHGSRIELDESARGTRIRFELRGGALR